MNKKEIIKDLREILKVYHYESDKMVNMLDKDGQSFTSEELVENQAHMDKGVVTSLENLLGSLLK
jgi:cytochrome b involved in lipid metabolism